MELGKEGRMKTFYLLRHEDVHNNSGIGVVAEGVIFDNGMCAMTWLSQYPTITMFPNIQTVGKLHGHDGKTEVIIEGKKKDMFKFTECKELARAKKNLNKKKEAE